MSVAVAVAAFALATSAFFLTSRRRIRVFAYGSLMWDAMPYRCTSTPAVLRHCVRRLCLWSYSGRGTPDSPGLYYGLVPVRGASCRGKLLTFSDGRILQWLDQREGDMYIRIRVRIDDRDAFAYIANPCHPQYDPHVTGEQIERAMSSRGEYGSTMEYVQNTLESIPD